MTGTTRYETVSPVPAPWSVQENRWKGHSVDGFRTAARFSSGLAGAGSFSNPVRFGRNPWDFFPLASFRLHSIAKPRQPSIGAGTLQDKRASSSFV